VLLLRDRYKNGIRSIANSLVMTIELFQIDDTDRIGSIGWEKNEKQQMAPRCVDMSMSMNTEKLAENAVSLNLKLMKWRVAPDIDLNIVKDYKCLLLGSGTLGCNVARCLLVSGSAQATL
jgi:ubiquitin-like modifier-activating enzyme ATG7